MAASAERSAERVVHRGIALVVKAKTRRKGQVRVFTAATCLLVVAGSSLFAGAALSSTPSDTWTGVPPSLPANASSNYSFTQDVACPGIDACVAVGSYSDVNGESQPLIDVQSGGSWTASVVPTPPAAVSAGLSSVACSDIGSCVAVGSFTDSSFDSYGLIETLTDGVWTASTAPEADLSASGQTQEFLTSVACPVAGSCVALGELGTPQNNDYTQLYAEIETSGTWNASPVPVPTSYQSNSYNEWDGLACPSAGSCVAVGVLIQNAPCTITCSIDQELAETLSNGSWSLTPMSPPGNAETSEPYSRLRSVACTDTDNCVAVGEYIDTNNGYQGLVETLTGGSWSSTEAPAPLGATNIGLSSVSCAAGGACTAVGEDVLASQDTALIETLSGGTWTPVTPPVPPDYAYSSSLQSVSCASSDSCVAVGGYDAKTNSTSSGTPESPFESEGLIETFSGGSWSATSAPLPGNAAGPGPVLENPITSLQAVSCPSADSCVAVGSYPVENAQLHADRPTGLLETESIGDALLGQVIGFSTSPPRPGIYGGSYTPIARGGGSGNPVTFSIDGSSTEGACSFDGTTVNFNGVGECVLDANQGGRGLYAAAPEEQQFFKINPATLTVGPANQSKQFGTTNPQVATTISGFVSGQDLATSGVSGDPACASTATQASPDGSYPITCTSGTLSAADYNFAFTPATLTVTCGQTITGSFAHPITLSSGQCAVIAPNADVTGPVTVESGGALDLESGSITGQLKASSPNALRLCGSKITGSVTVTGSDSLVVLGDDEGTPLCGGNTISGPVSVTGNSDGVEVDGNSISGSLTITGNTGSVPPPDTGTVVATGNTASGTINVQPG